MQNLQKSKIFVSGQNAIYIDNCILYQHVMTIKVKKSLAFYIAHSKIFQLYIFSAWVFYHEHLRFQRDCSRQNESLCIFENIYYIVYLQSILKLQIFCCQRFSFVFTYFSQLDQQHFVRRGTKIVNISRSAFPMKLTMLSKFSQKCFSTLEVAV